MRFDFSFMFLHEERKEYGIFSTFANPEAVEFLREFRFLEERALRDSNGKLPEGYNGRDLIYDSTLMRLYLGTLERLRWKNPKLAPSRFDGRIPDCLDSEDYLFSAVHITECNVSLDELRLLVDLLSKKSSMLALKKEARMYKKNKSREVEILMQYGLPPLILDNRRWSCTNNPREFRTKVYFHVPWEIRDTFQLVSR